MFTLNCKNVYTELTEKQGFPVWAVLALFVVVTIALGLVMGILLIIFIDCICPPKKYSKDYQDFKQVCQAPSKPHFYRLSLTNHQFFIFIFKNDIGDESDLKQQEAKASEGSKSSDEEATTKKRTKKSDNEQSEPEKPTKTRQTRQTKKDN